MGYARCSCGKVFKVTGRKNNHGVKGHRLKYPSHYEVDRWTFMPHDAEKQKVLREVE